MTLPREGSRDVGRGIVVSASPDVCLTPVGAAMVPVPYSLIAHRDRSAANMANPVRQTGLVTHVAGSLITQSFGDEPGTGGGVKSGTTGKECEPKTWSSSVRAEGRHVVRHDDEWWMNHRNTVGRLTDVKDDKSYETPEAERVEPRMSGGSGQPGAAATDAGPEPIRSGAHYAQLAVPVPRPIPMPPIPQEQSTKAADALWTGVKELKP